VTHPTGRQETIDLLMGLSHALSANFGSVAGELGVSALHARALIGLNEPAAMRDLAATLGCDKSHVTGIADGLERRGLVTREPDPHDRRIRQLVLTAEGRRVRAELRRRLVDDAPVLSRLTPDEDTQLRELLRTAFRRQAEADPTGAHGCG
jgi:DNA-binding MarR family transcriptional regulator